MVCQICLTSVVARGLTNYDELKTVNIKDLLTLTSHATGTGSWYGYFCRRLGCVRHLQSTTLRHLQNGKKQNDPLQPKTSPIFNRSLGNA